MEYEPSHEKTNNLIFQPSLTQTRLYSYRSRLEASPFGLKKRDCTICVAKIKTLISCAVTAQLICAFVLPIHVVGFLMQQLINIRDILSYFVQYSHVIPFSSICHF